MLSGLTSQSTWSTKGFWNSGCCHSWTGKEIHSECFGYWLGLKLCYGLLGFCVMKNLFFCQFELVFHTASFTSCSCMSSGMNEVFKLILKKYTAWTQCGSVPNCQSHIRALEHTGKYFGQTDFLMLQNLRNSFNTFFPHPFFLHSSPPYPLNQREIIGQNAWNGKGLMSQRLTANSDLSFVLFSLEMPVDFFLGENKHLH